MIAASAAAVTASVAAAPASAATTAIVTAPAQTVAGFGASGAWWVNDLKNFSSSAQSQVASLLFTSSGIDLSQYRYNIGGGGAGVTVAARAPQTFLTSSGSYNWSNDPGGQYFLKAAAADGVPDLIGFVNSAPSEYTTNGENCAGEINTADDAAYGTYLATIVSHFASEGVTINQVSPMNEPDDSFSSCGQEGMEVPRRARRRDRRRRLCAVRRGLSAKVIADESSKTTQLLSEAPTWLADASAPSYLAAIAHHTTTTPRTPRSSRSAGSGTSTASRSGPPRSAVRSPGAAGTARSTTRPSRAASRSRTTSTPTSPTPTTAPSSGGPRCPPRSAAIRRPAAPAPPA